MGKAENDLFLAASALKAFIRGENSEEAETGSLLFAKALLGLLPRKR